MRQGPAHSRATAHFGPADRPVRARALNERSEVSESAELLCLYSFPTVVPQGATVSGELFLGGVAVLYLCLGRGCSTIGETKS